MVLPFEPKILAYSTSWVNNPIMTALIPVPTVKLAELRTHRLFSQFESEIINTSTNDNNLSCNANSSRAIPIEKQLLFSSERPYSPIWTEKQKGMQGKIINDNVPIYSSNIVWNVAYKSMCNYVEVLNGFDIHKQDVSLLLNPFTWTTCVITGDKKAWENWFNLRCPNYNLHGKRYYSKKECVEAFGTSDINFNEINISMTYPAIQVIAEKLYNLWTYNSPEYLDVNQWHIAYVKDIDTNLPTKDKLYISMSKCAMISFDNHDKEESLESHINRAKRLIRDKHDSTMEHQYQVPSKQELLSHDFMEGYKSLQFNDDIEYHIGKYVSNVKGWKQLRKIVENDRETNN